MFSLCDRIVTVLTNQDQIDHIITRIRQSGTHAISINFHSDINQHFIPILSDQNVANFVLISSLFTCLSPCVFCLLHASTVLHENEFLLKSLIIILVRYVCV